MKELVWLKNNGFKKIERPWVEDKNEADYYDNTWEKKICDKAVCRLTFKYQEDTWESEVYFPALVDFLDFNTFTENDENIEKAFEKALKKARRFLDLVKELV